MKEKTKERNISSFICWPKIQYMICKHVCSSLNNLVSIDYRFLLPNGIDLIVAFIVANLALYLAFIVANLGQRHFKSLAT